ncbi:phosphotransferase [Marinobacter sp. KMM 10035]|uniref:phosphotransferase n=1 Tax=Marinobacter sp. KMM 10035 TaxID=3134034 RepID=UPI00397BE412
MSKIDKQIRVNPRSTGVVSSETYEKHSTEISLKSESEELARCRDKNIQTENVKTVEIISFSESENLLVTRKIVAQELFHTVWNPTYLLGRMKGNRLSNPEIVRARIVEVGTWLRKYHESSLGGVQSGSDGRWLEEAFHEKIRIIRQGRLMPEAKLAQIERVFGAELSKLNKPSYLEDNGAFRCRVHGDFLIYNILIDCNQNLHVLDFGDTRISGNLEDVSRFYSGLWAISKTNRARHKLLGDLPRRFLEAYGVAPKILDNPYFRCNLAYNFLTHLTGQHYMKELLSWNSNREMSQITRAGLKWVYQQI